MGHGRCVILVVMRRRGQRVKEGRKLCYNGKDGIDRREYSIEQRLELTMSVEGVCQSVCQSVTGRAVACGTWAFQQMNRRADERRHYKRHDTTHVPGCRVARVRHDLLQGALAADSGALASWLGARDGPLPSLPACCTQNGGQFSTRGTE